MPTNDFAVPQSVFECRDRIERLQDEIKTIESHLADPNKTNKTGKRLTAKQYHTWRKNAIRAVNIKAEELRFLKRWLIAFLQEIEAGRTGIDPTDCRSLLEGAYRAFEHIKNVYGVDSLDDDVLTTMDLVRDYVKGTVQAKKEYH